MPFCSNRCRMIDLGRWLNEEYGLPHTPHDEDDEEALDDLDGETRWGEPHSDLPRWD